MLRENFKVLFVAVSGMGAMDITEKVLNSLPHVNNSLQIVIALLTITYLTRKIVNNKK